jgi:hypothetical protein
VPVLDQDGFRIIETGVIARNFVVPVPLTRASVPCSVFFDVRICFLVSFTQDASEVFASGWFRHVAGEDAVNAELPSESAPV